MAMAAAESNQKCCRAVRPHRAYLHLLVCIVALWCGVACTRNAFVESGGRPNNFTGTLSPSSRLARGLVPSRVADHARPSRNIQTLQTSRAVDPSNVDALSTVLAAGLPTTPASVSVAFNVISLFPQYLWLLIVFAPNWSVTRAIMTPLWPVLCFCLVHLFIVLTVASTNPDNIQDFEELLKVFDPEVLPNLFTDFRPQASMMKLMESPGFVSEEWSHVLAWDLFVGRWIWLDGQKRGIFTSHSVLLSNLIGPPGLLLHAATCLVLGRGLPEEKLPETDGGS